MPTNVPTAPTVGVDPDMMKAIQDALAGKKKETLEGHFENVEELLSRQAKKEVKRGIELKKIEDRRAKREKSLEQLQIMGEISKKEFRNAKARNNIDAYLQKFMVKSNFLQGMGRIFTGIGAGIKKLGAGGLLKGLLKLFLMGGLMKILLPFFMNGIRTIVNMLITMLPPLLKYLWDAFWNIIVPGFAGIGKAIGESIFGKGSIFGKLFEIIGGFLPILFVVNKVLGLFGSSLGSLVWGILKTVFATQLETLAKALATGGTLGLASALWAMLAPMLPIILAVALVVAGFVLLYKYAEKVSDWFDGLWAKFKKLNTWAKIGIAVLAAIFWPITSIFLVVWGFAKLFKSIKKIGFKATMLLIWEAIKKAASDLWDSAKAQLKKELKTIGRVFSGLWEAAKAKLKSWFDSAMSKISDFFKPLTDLFPTVSLKGAKKAVGDKVDQVWGLVKGTVLDGFEATKKAFQRVLDWFTGFSTFSNISWLSASSEAKGNMYKWLETARSKKLDTDVLTDLAKEDVKLEAVRKTNPKEVAFYEEMLRLAKTKDQSDAFDAMIKDKNGSINSALKIYELNPNVLSRVKGSKV